MMKSANLRLVFIIKRTLFTQESLGMVGFSQWCTERQKLCGLPKEIVMARVDKSLPSERFILTDDFKNALAYSQDDTNFDSLTYLIKLYHEQTKNTKISHFNFGPFVMRLFYARQQPQLAYDAILNKDLNGFFEQLSSYQICMDLLYECEQYDKLLNVWQHYCNSKLASKIKYPRSLIVLIYASLYKMNSKDAVEEGLQLYSSYRESTGKNIPRKALTFLVGLITKLEHNNELAYELLSTTNCNDFLAGRCLKLVLLARLQRPNDVFRLFQNIIEADLPGSSFEDVELPLEMLQVFERTCKLEGESKEKFDRYVKLLKQGKHLISVTLDELICSPVVLSPSSSDEVLEELPVEDRLKLLTSSDANEKRLSVISYDDDSVAMESLSKFVKAEKRQKRREKIVQTVAQQIIKDGPLDV